MASLDDNHVAPDVNDLRHVVGDRGDMTDPTKTADADVRYQEFQLGHGLRATILTTSAETEGRHDLIDGRLASGDMTPLHLHRRYEERLWVVAGRLEVWLGEQHAVLGSGDFVHVPRQVPHAIRAGDDGARALNISSPAGFAELVARAGTPAELATAEVELDLERFMQLTHELGDVVLGPPGTLPADLTPEEVSRALADAEGRA
jgi:quercetin dioxygenase-like cupin family protein